MKKILLSMVLGLSFVCTQGGLTRENSDQSYCNTYESRDSSAFCDFEWNNFFSECLESLQELACSILDCCSVSCFVEDEYVTESEDEDIVDASSHSGSVVAWQTSMTSTPVRTMYTQQQGLLINRQFAPQPDLPRAIEQQGDGDRVTIFTGPDGQTPLQKPMKSVDYSSVLEKSPEESDIVNAWPLNIRQIYWQIIDVIKTIPSLKRAKEVYQARKGQLFKSNNSEEYMRDILQQLTQELDSALT